MGGYCDIFGIKYDMNGRLLRHFWEAYYDIFGKLDDIFGRLLRHFWGLKATFIGSNYRKRRGIRRSATKIGIYYDIFGTLSRT